MLKPFFVVFILLFSLQSFGADNDCLSRECTQEVADFIAGKAFQKSDDGEVDVKFALINDNTYGLFELMSGDKLGDDFGNTHGVLIEVARTDSSGVNYKLVYFTAIYSERDSAKYYTDEWGSTYDQKFTEENILKIIMNNKAQENDRYYELGVGVIELNRQEVRSWLTASGQQLGLHDAIGSFHPNNIPSSKENEIGGFIEAAVGKQAEFISPNQRVRIIGDVKISGILSSIEDSSSSSISAGADFYYQANKDSWAYKAGAKVITTAHQTASTPSARVELSLGIARGNYTFELLVQKIFAGTKQNYQDYNYDREAIFTLQFTGKFGSVRRYR